MIIIIMILFCHWLISRLFSPAGANDSDSDSDAYCDPENVPAFQPRLNPQSNQAPQKGLPPPPADDSDHSSSDEDSDHNYEDPSESIPYARHVSLRRGSMPVFNPDAYLVIKGDDSDCMYQDVSISILGVPKDIIKHPLLMVTFSKGTDRIPPLLWICSNVLMGYPSIVLNILNNTEYLLWYCIPPEHCSNVSKRGFPRLFPKLRFTLVGMKW